MPALMEVLEFLDDSGNVMVQRVPSVGQCSIRWGAQLTVRESQAAVFVRDGKALDVFPTGRYVLETQNVPVVGKWITGFGYGPQSPFRAEVYFLNLKLFPNLRWGTREPVVFRDAELQMIRLRSNGIFSLQIADPTVFLNKVVGTQGLYLDNHIHDYLRNTIVTRLTTVLGKHFKTIFDVPTELDNLSLMVRSSLRDDFGGLGLSLHDFLINSVSVPPNVQQLIDARAGMAAVGNMDQFMRFKAAMALETAADNPGGGAAAGVGVGAGVGLGFMLPQMMRDAFTAPHPTPETPATDTALDTIRHLKELVDLGAITQDEFEHKKQELLKEI